MTLLAKVQARLAITHPGFEIPESLHEVLGQIDADMTAYKDQLEARILKLEAAMTVSKMVAPSPPRALQSAPMHTPV